MRSPKIVPSALRLDPLKAILAKLAPLRRIATGLGSGKLGARGGCRRESASLVAQEIAHHSPPCPPKIAMSEFVADSLLEGTRFEPSVPRALRGCRSANRVS